MSYEHNVDACFTGGNGLSEGRFRALLADSDAGLQSVRSARDDGSLPLFRLPDRRDDIDDLVPVARRFRESFAHVVVLGTGGSSLGGQTFYGLADRGFGPPAGTPHLHFMDNVDPDTFDQLLTALPPAETGIVAISKSGTTAETLTQLTICLDAFRKSGAGDRIAAHFLVVTEPKPSVMRAMAENLGIPVLDHDPAIGGRFSALSLVGLLPAMIAGLDPVAVRAGAMSVLRPVLEKSPAATIAPAVGAAVSIGLAEEHGIGTSVLMPYVDRLAYFGLWYRQLWAESLGKDGQGTTPVRAIGTVDQHSQLQLYLDGPRDKMFTVVMQDCAGQGRRVPADLAADDSLAYLRGRSIGDLMDAEQRATAETLIRNGCPTRIIKVRSIDEKTVGALMMHYMLETILAAHHLRVDPFDQPAVEQGKILTRQYLSESGGDRA